MLDIESLDAIRRRATAATAGRDDENGDYSVFTAVGSGRVGDIGAAYHGDVEFDFPALAIGGPTHSKYNDHIIALVPEQHANAAANAEFFAHARNDVLRLVESIVAMSRRLEQISVLAGPPTTSRARSH